MVGGAGAAALATGLAQGAWMLGQLAVMMPGLAVTTRPDPGGAAVRSCSWPRRSSPRLASQSRCQQARMLRMRRPGSRWPRCWTAPGRSPPPCAARRGSHSTCWWRWPYGPGCGLTPPSCMPRSWSLPPALSRRRHGHECHAQADGCPCTLGNRAHCRGMMHYNEPLHLSSPAADALPADRVRLAAFAYLARFTGSSREHTESDLRCYLRWCADRGLARWPRAARTWSGTSGGCRKPAGSSPPPSHGGSRWPPGSTAPASSTPC